MLKLLSVQHGNHSTFLTHHRKRIAVLFGLLCFCMAGLTGRLVFLMLYRADHYSEMAEELHQRERSIKAARGRILDPGSKWNGDRSQPDRLHHFRDP